MKCCFVNNFRPNVSLHYVNFYKEGSESLYKSRYVLLSRITLNRQTVKGAMRAKVPTRPKAVKYSSPKGISSISLLETRVMSTCLACCCFSKTNRLTAMLGTVVSGRSIIVLCCHHPACNGQSPKHILISVQKNDEA